MHSNSKTQQAHRDQFTGGRALTPSAQPSPTPSTSNNSSQRLRTTSASLPSTSTSINKHCSFLRFIFCKQVWFKRWESTNEQNIYNFAFCGFRICIRVDNLFFAVFQQKTTQLMHSQNHWQLPPLQRHLSAVGIQTDVANEAGEYNNIFFVVDNINKKNNKKQKQQPVALCQPLHPQTSTSSCTTDICNNNWSRQQQRSGQQISILQLSGGTSPTTTLDNWQQIDQHQSADSNIQQQQHRNNRLLAMDSSSSTTSSS